MKTWLPVFGISFCSFIFVTSEFTPVGLISEMGQTFSKSESETGLLMTIYAWTVALLSIPLTAYSARFNRRPLMLTLLAIFSLANFFSVIAPTFETLMVSRLLVASTHAVFWAIAVPFGIRIAPKGKKERAMSLVSTGATLGGVLGIPLATIIGQALGWRMSFGIIGVCSSIIGLMLYRLLPSTPSLNAGNFKSIIPLMKRKELILVYLMVAIIMTGQYAIYTFISPYLESVGGMSKDLIASILLIFGFAGFVTSFFAPNMLRWNFKHTANLSVFAVALSLFLFKFSVSSYALTVLLVLVWGVAFMLFNLVIQNLVLAIAPDAEDVAMAGYSGIYNIGIGGGALIGSIAATNTISSLGFYGSAFVFISGLICMYLLKGSHLINKIKVSKEARH